MVLTNHEEDSMFPTGSCLTRTSATGFTAAEEPKHKDLLPTELPVLRVCCASCPAQPGRGDVKESTESSVLCEEGVSAILRAKLGKAPATVDRTCEVWW